MGAFFNCVNKEIKHILRDNRTLLLIFGLPIVMLLLYGFAITTDVKNVRVVVVTANMDKDTQRVIDRINASNDFHVVGLARTPQEAKAMIRKQKTDVAVLFSSGFANHKYTGQAGVQVICDGADPNSTIQQTNYLRQIVVSSLMNAMDQDLYTIRLLYNPQIKSIYYFVPGLTGALLLLFCTMMTAVSIVREKETGSMEVILVSPVHPFLIIASKLFPYLVISILVQILNMLITYFILEVPIRGNVGSILLMSTLYAMVALMLGLLVSIVARRQITAILTCSSVFIIPTVMLSDMIYPIESLPVAIQQFSTIVPARWFVSAMRKIMVMGLDLNAVQQEIKVLLLMLVVLATLALANFKKRLE
jgi:ABC-2 type transport system permease protein